MAISDPKLKAQGLDGITYRVEINGGNTTVTAARAFLTFEIGADVDVRLDPIKPTKVRVFVLDEDLLPLFGETGRSVPVEVYDDDTGNLEFDGYLLGSNYEDSPFRPDNVVELQALDGLGTIENDPLDSALTAGTTRDVRQAIVDLLNTVNPLRVDFADRWYPGTGNLSSSTEPLGKLEFAVNNYRASRQAPKEGDFQSQLFTLRDLLKRFGLRVQQTRQNGELIWSVRQIGAVKESSSAGDLKIWRYEANGNAVSGYPQTINILNDLTDDNFRIAHTRDPERQRKEVRVTYDHVRVKNAINEASFETINDWTFSSTTGVSFSGKQDHANTAWTPQALTQDQYYAYITENPDKSSQGRFKWAEQSLGSINEAEAQVNGLLSYEVGAKTVTPDNRRLPSDIQLNVGSYWLTQDGVETRSESLAGEGRLWVQSVAASIPKGATLPIYRQKNIPVAGSFETFDATITLTERAEKGDTILRGQITKKIPTDSTVVYPYMSGTKDWLISTYFVRPAVLDNPTYWTSVNLLFAWAKPGGGPISGSSSVALGQYLTTTGGTTHQNGVDNMRLSLQKDGSPIDQTLSEATLSQPGKVDEINTRVGQGPTQQNLSRLRGKGFSPGSWGIGSGGGSLTLGELHARERLRYFRDTNKRFRITFPSRSKSPRLRGHEIVKFDGDLYRVSSLTYNATSGEYELELLQYKDYGI